MGKLRPSPVQVQLQTYEIREEKREDWSKAAHHVLLPGIYSAPLQFLQASNFQFGKNTLCVIVARLEPCVFFIFLTFLLFTVPPHFLYSAL